MNRFDVFLIELTSTPINKLSTYSKMTGFAERERDRDRDRDR